MNRKLLQVKSDETQSDYGGLRGTEVAEVLNISKQAVSQAEKNAIRRLWRDSLLLSNIKDKFEKENLY